MKKQTYICLFLVLYIFCMLQSDVFVLAAQDTAAQELSQEELSYLQEKGTLRVSVLTDWKPFCYRDEAGVYQGLPISILKRLEEATGITLELIPAESYEESLQQLTSGEVDACSIFMYYPKQKQNTTVNAPIRSIHYLTSQMILVSHKSTDLEKLSSSVLADVKGRSGYTYNQSISTMYYKSQEKCFTAVRSGQADFAICDNFTGSLLMQQYKTRDLVSMQLTTTMDFGFGILQQTDERLASSLNKMSQSFTRGEVNHILAEGCTLNGTDILQFVYYYPIEIICFCFAVMFVLLLSMQVYTKLRLKHHQSLQGYEESYRLLSDTFGEAGLEYDYLNDQITLFGQNSNLDINQVEDDFHEKLRTNAIRISLTPDEFDKILMDGAEGKSFCAEFQCGVKSGGWIWYRLIYTVICTTESYRRPIRLVGCLTNIDGEQQEKERLMQLSLNDQLTELYNRTAAENKINKRLVAEGEVCLGLMVVLDIDHFKKFNDERGHFCGDDVLRCLGKYALECFSSTDILCRWGGDEFLFYLEEESADVQRIIAKFNLLCKKMRGYTYNGNPCPVTLSAGAAKRCQGCTFEGLFAQADEALYLAKKKGRDQLLILDSVEKCADWQGEVR